MNVLRVKVENVFSVNKTAWSIIKNQKSYLTFMTTPSSGLYGQSNQLTTKFAFLRFRKDFSTIISSKKCSDMRISTISLERIRKLHTSNKNFQHTVDFAIVEKIKNYNYGEKSITFSKLDAIRYALSIGANIEEDEPYIYEGYDEFSVFPTIYNALAVNITLDHILNGLPGGDEIGLKGLKHVLHGEEFIEFYKPFPINGEITIKTSIVDVIDKMKFCKVLFENTIYDGDRNKLGRILSAFLFMESGGVGSKGDSNVIVPAVYLPDRPPDAMSEDNTSQNQAALYRLSGDLNPLHISPSVAKYMGFTKPILHGLCSYGFALRHVLKTFDNNESSSFKAMKAQFSGPVFPGDTLVTEMWSEGSQIIFQMKVKENGNKVLKGGFIDLNFK